MERLLGPSYLDVVGAVAVAGNDGSLSESLPQRFEVEQTQLSEVIPGVLWRRRPVVAGEFSGVEVGAKAQLRTYGMAAVCRVVARVPRDRMVSHSLSTHVSVTGRL